MASSSSSSEDNTNVVEIVGEYHPQSIIQWSAEDCKLQKDLILKAKKHLVLIYTSPTGKTYASLRQACKGCIQQQEKEGEAASSMSKKKEKQENLSKKDVGSSCYVCYGEGENVIFCSQCQRPFHQGCLGVSYVSSDNWFCPCCSCKICKSRNKDFDDDKDKSRFLACYQCEMRYHCGCFTDLGYGNMDTILDEKYGTCKDECDKVFFGLQKLVGKSNFVCQPNLSWTLLKASEGDGVEDSVRKLTLALDLLYKYSEPVRDLGRDVLSDIVFSKGSKLSSLSYHGFHTVILERGAEMITVATLRIFGYNVAEIPFIVTKEQSRKLERMCGILMTEILKNLTSWRVKSIVLHSSPDMVDMWINRFGFAKMSNGDKSRFIGLQCNLLYLNNGSIMCHKSLVK